MFNPAWWRGPRFVTIYVRIGDTLYVPLRYIPLRFIPQEKDSRRCLASA